AWNTTDAAASPQRTGRIGLFGDLERRFSDDHGRHADVDPDFDAILARRHGLVGFRRRNGHFAFAFGEERNVGHGELRDGGTGAVQQGQGALGAHRPLAGVLEHGDDADAFFGVSAEQVRQFDVERRRADVDVDQRRDAAAKLHFTAAPLGGVGPWRQELEQDAGPVTGRFDALRY